MTYLYWLLGISAVFFVLERLLPARRGQRALRPQLGNDLFYLVLHGYLWSFFTGGLIGLFATWTKGGLGLLGLMPKATWLSGTSAPMQFLVYLLVADFLQWNVHRLLHRVPLLWKFHQVHHSIQDMDWAGAFRFHWMEVVVYRSLLYVPLLFLGGDSGPLFAVAIFSTIWGHFNHSNLALDIGPLARVFNSPRMHLWHHDASDEGGTAKNFGIVLSLWDWLFGTAYWPRDRAPARLGFPEDERMPADLPRQLAYPLLPNRSSN